MLRGGLPPWEAAGIEAAAWNFYLLQPGQPKTVQILIEGTSPEPVVLTAEGLPPSATLTGTTLAFDGSTGQEGEQFQFTIIATSGGLTSRALVRGDIQP